MEFSKGKKAMNKTLEKDFVSQVGGGEALCEGMGVNSGVNFNLSLGIGPKPTIPKEIAKKAPIKNPADLYCRSCGITQTPLWRKGPQGSKTLCNACGLRYWKEERILSSKLTLGQPIPKNVKKK